MKTNCVLTIDDKEYYFPVEGEFSYGEDILLYNPGDSVIDKTVWSQKGFDIVALYSIEESAILKESSRLALLRIFDDVGIRYDEKFALETYHEYADTKEKHAEVIKRSVQLKNIDFGIDMSIIARRISEIVGYDLQSYIPDLEREIIQLRIIRPNSYDINPPHRDAYLDYYRKVLNLWLPLAGVNENSSLPVMPGSHLWNEKDIFRTPNHGAVIDGNKYRVPAIINTNHGMAMKRAVPAEGEALIFTPYLIHGAAVNQNKDITRMALELRLYKH